MLMAQLCSSGSAYCSSSQFMSNFTFGQPEAHWKTEPPWRTDLHSPELQMLFRPSPESASRSLAQLSPPPFLCAHVACR